MADERREGTITGESEVVRGHRHGHLPPIGGAGDARLPDAAVRYLNFRSAMETTIVVVVGSVAALAISHAPTRWGIVALLVLALVVGVAVELPFLNRLKVRWTSYTVTSSFIYITRGFMVRRTVVIATPQVLNVECVEGPLLRALGLVTVKFTCIADVEKLGPLLPDEANMIRLRVLSAYGADDE